MLLGAIDTSASKRRSTLSPGRAGVPGYIYFESLLNMPLTGRTIKLVNRFQESCARQSTEAAGRLAVLLLVAWLGLLASPVVAQKTDVVHMSNGNVIIGEVKRMEHGLLEFSVDDIVNRLQIKWE